MALAEADRRHDLLIRNTLRLFANHLQGQRYQPFTNDTYVAISAGSARQPDLGIDYAPFHSASLEAAEPALVVEVLLPTARMFDFIDKLEDYKTVPSLDYILLIDADYPQLRLYQRDAGRVWISERVSGLEAVVALSIFEFDLRLADVYASLEFRPRPSLVSPEHWPSSPSPACGRGLG